MKAKSKVMAPVHNKKQKELGLIEKKKEDHLAD